jgi:hypothetical protein
MFRAGIKANPLKLLSDSCTPFDTRNGLLVPIVLVCGFLPNFNLRKAASFKKSER